MKKKIVVILIILILVLSIVSFAHSGRTDSNGGHYDWSTGEYRYHNGGSSETAGQYKFPEDDYEELYKEVCKEKTNLEDEIYDLKETIETYEMDLEDAGYNSIQEMEKKLNEKENEISNLWTMFIFLFGIGLIVSYNIGYNKDKK